MADGDGRNCLHLALTAPFSIAKIQWAKMLARFHSNLLKEPYQSGNENEKRSMMPIPHFTEQRKGFETLQQKGGSMQLTNEREKLKSQLMALEDTLKLQCLAEYDELTCKSIMYRRRNGQGSSQFFLISALSKGSRLIQQ